MSLKNTANELSDEEFADELKPETKLMLGQYTIEGFLAAGGFGITYLAKDSLGRRVVIKECFPGSFCRRQAHSVMPRSRAHQNELKSIVRLFSQEAMALAKANHPNIVGVHQVFEENNTAYMALDYVHGRDLLEILEEDRDSLKPELVEGYLVKILDAIKHIHQLDMLHRDIAPDNIIINEAGEPILIDFGAARESTNERVTRMLSALRVVKDGYSPQEFYIAGSEQGPSCDLYSLAASFYHIATGELPPDSQSRLSACAAGDEDPYVSLGEKTDAYSKRFVTALDKAMSVLPRDRMQSAEEWIAHLGGETIDAPAPAAAPAVKSTKDDAKTKSFMPMLLGTTAMAAIAGVGFFLLNSGDDTTTAATDQGSAVTTALATDTGSASVDTASTEAPSAAPTVPAAPASVNPEAVAAPEPVQPETEVSALPQPIQSEEPVVATPEPEFDLSALPVQPDLPQVRPIPRPENATGPETVSPDLPAVENVATEIAGLTPPIVGAAESGAPRTLEPLSFASEPAALDGDGVALSALQDSVPVVVTTTPEAPQPVIVEAPAPADEPVAIAEAEPTPQASEPAVEENSALAFFMAMDKEQPDILSAATPPAATVPQTVPTPSPAQAAPAQETVEAAPAPAAPGNAPVAAPEIMTSFVPLLPFTLSSWQPGMVSFVGEGSPEWLTQSARIVSINGTRVDSNDQIMAQLEQVAAGSSASSVEVTFGVEPRLNAPVEEHALVLETERHTLLLNGLRLAARESNGTWTTEVVEAPTGSNFQPGDTLVSYVATWEDLNGPDTLQTILERELANGTSAFSFAVSRDGEIWVEDFNLAALN